jgi:hypothetical protein
MYVTQSQNTVVSQKNDASISNTINASSNSGGNTASRNTGGDSTIDTGNTKTEVRVENSANSNVANVDNCNCDTDALVKISDNGADSENKAKLNLDSKTTVAQNNNADITNKINADSTSGDNNADRNTGGVTSISTGNAWTGVAVKNEANSNWANVGGDGDGSSVAVLINGNGTKSDNNVDLYLDRDMTLQQYNDSDINNWINAGANTGDNKADKNTGGEVSIETGWAKTAVLADTSANFNWADVGCDCLTDVHAKIAGNGYKTDNTIKAKLSDDQNIFQENSCGERGYETALWGWDWYGNDDCVTNHLNADSNTGDNRAKENTDGEYSDPSISTGNSETVAQVKTAGNGNIFGAEPDSDMPDASFNGVNLNITFSLSDLMAALGIH